MIQVVDLGINNLSSLVRALEEVSEETVSIATRGSDLAPGNLLVVPGTGNYGEAMNRVESRGFDEVFVEWEQRGEGLLVGVCLGMQLLFESSQESSEARGLSLIPGHVESLTAIGSSAEKVPHVGWSEVRRSAPGSFGWLGVEDGTDFYFSHSFALMSPTHSRDEYLLTSFGAGSFVSAIRRRTVLGFQFHPEKSSFAGRNVLASVVRESRALA
jgi:glutamine amidotransferase